MAIALLFVGGAAGYHWGCTGRQGGLPPALAVSPGAAQGFNVVLFTLDTLRADYLRCYGRQSVETPNLDAMAAGGVRCADAVTAVPLTLPAHCTILTGNYPPRHGVRTNGAYRLPPEQVTLAERLKEAGYATAAFISAFVLDGRFGTSQGFDVYRDEIDPHYRSAGQARDIPQQPGNVVTDAALAWLDTHQRTANNRPFFMWVHLFDPHAPYEPPEPFATRYATDLYGGEVAFTDQQVGRLIERLRELKLLDRTVIVAVGDHGEGLGEHGEETHSILIYEATMWVPLIFYCPGVLPAGVVLDDRVVATADIMPTVLDLLGLPPGSCDGLSLLRAGTPAQRVAYLESLAPRERGWSPLRGLRRHRDKYIEAPKPEYYDLAADPREQQNLFAETGPAGELRDQLAALLANFPTEQKNAQFTPDAEALSKLAALGYVGGRAVVTDGPAIDPKDVIVAWEREWGRAWRAMNAGRYRDAISALEVVLSIAPGDGDGWATLSKAQYWEGLLDKALESRLRAVELEPNKVHNWVDLAQLQRQKGDLRGMLASLAEAERVDPNYGDIYLLRATVASEQKRYDEALALCEDCLLYTSPSPRDS